MKDGRTSQRVYERLEKIFDPRNPLHREDVIWVLEFIKGQVAVNNSHLTTLSKDRLLKNFHYFAEVAMLMIEHRWLRDQKTEQLKEWLFEACHGLYPQENGQEKV